MCCRAWKRECRMRSWGCCSVHCAGTKACVQTTCHAGTVLEWSNSHKIPIDLIWTRIRNGLVMWGDCRQSIFCATMITTSMSNDGRHHKELLPFTTIIRKKYFAILSTVLLIQDLQVNRALFHLRSRQTNQMGRPKRDQITEAKMILCSTKAFIPHTLLHFCWATPILKRYSFADF